MSSNVPDPPTTTEQESPTPPTSSAAPPPATSTPPRSSSAPPPPPTSDPEPTTQAPPESTDIILITSIVTQSPTAPGATPQPPSVVIVTSTAQNSQQSSSLVATSSRSRTSSASPIATDEAQGSSSSGGFSEKGKIAVAVVVPIVAIAAIIVGLLFFWKKRKARKSAEEQRGKEMEEYGFNPNNDPTIPPVSAAYGDNKSEAAEDGVGYRGWGATNSSTGRGPSNQGRSPAIGTALSDGGSNGHGYHADRRSDRHSTDPIVVSGPGNRPPTGESDVGALGGPPVAGSHARQPGVNRGASNASSAYSTGPPQSDASDDFHGGAGAPGGYHHEGDNPYYNDAQGPPGPYGDANYGAQQPVIRDVQARRNTRIEKPTVYPQQGNTGISQNF